MRRRWSNRYRSTARCAPSRRRPDGESPSRLGQGTQQGAAPSSTRRRGSARCAGRRSPEPHQRGRAPVVAPAPASREAPNACRSARTRRWRSRSSTSSPAHRDRGPGAGRGRRRRGEPQQHAGPEVHARVQPLPGAVAAARRRRGRSLARGVEAPEPSGRSAFDGLLGLAPLLPGGAAPAAGSGPGTAGRRGRRACRTGPRRRGRGGCCGTARRSAPGPPRVRVSSEKKRSSRRTGANSRSLDEGVTDVDPGVVELRRGGRSSASRP